MDKLYVGEDGVRRGGGRGRLDTVTVVGCRTERERARERDEKLDEHAQVVKTRRRLLKTTAATTTWAGLEMIYTTRGRDSKTDGRARGYLRDGSGYRPCIGATAGSSSNSGVRRQYCSTKPEDSGGSVRGVGGGGRSAGW
jgi:hypothetical protein